MGRRVPRTANAVSLFPFLAVLICAMGALILLLLVTTRRIRQQQAQQAVVEVVVPVVTAELPPPEPPPAAPPHESPPVVSEYLDAPLEPLFALTPVPALPDPNDEWRAKLRNLEAEHTRLVASVADQASAAEQMRASLAIDSRELDLLHHEAAAIDEERANLETLFERLQQEQIDTENRSLFLKQQIDETREQLARSASKYSILPYDGRLGTVRRPIIIECTEDAISFVSEGVTLTPADLDGFTPKYNPLTAASRALSKYWARKDREEGAADNIGEPYVLLVVRPRGTIAYYIVRKLLGSNLDAFGYELVREDQEFAWPESDAMATRICRTIVERMISDKNAMIAAMPDHMQDPFSDFSDEGGLFRMEEVDRTRNRDEVQGITINGHQYVREPQKMTGSGATTFTRSGSHLPSSRDRRNSEYDSQRHGISSSDSAREGMGDSAIAESDAGSSPVRLQPLRPTESDRPTRNPLLNPTGPPRLSPPPSPSLPFAEFVRESRTQVGSIADEKADGPADELADFMPPGSQLRSSRSNGGGTASLDWNASNRDVSASPGLAGMTSGEVPPGVNGENPQWGIRSPGGTIGFERDVSVRVTAEQVTIADETSFPITAGMSTEDLRRLLATHLNHQVQSWGQPPRSFYWLPTVNYLISPGGNQFYERLKAVTQRWRVRSSVKYVLE